jgi:hypothetical protein
MTLTHQAQYLSSPVSERTIRARQQSAHHLERRPVDGAAALALSVVRCQQALCLESMRE